MNNVEEIAYKFAMGSIFALVMIFHSDLQAIKKRQEKIEDRLEEVLRLVQSYTD
ncbi:MAG: hypothetical protein AB8B73_02960 [Ekhidna sp.]